MKRLTYILLAVGLLGVLCFITICKRDVLPQPVFPLEEEAVIAALEKTGLPGKISESETTSGERRIQYVVRSQTETYSDSICPEEAYANPYSRVLIASIFSGIIEDERMLSIMFDQKDIPEQFAWENWKQQIVLATLLYGGFKNEDEIYQTILEKAPPAGEDSFEWSAQLSGGYCWVHYNSRKSHTNYGEYEIRKLRHSGTMIVKIFESKALFQKYQENIQ